MPERETAQKAILKVQTDLENQSNTMQKEYADKLKVYQEQLKTYSDRHSPDQGRGITKYCNKEFRTFQQQASQNMEQERSKQLQPILEKARKAVSDVSKETRLAFWFSR